MDAPLVGSGGTSRRLSSGLRALLATTLVVCAVTLVSVFVFGGVVLSRLPVHHRDEARLERLRAAMPLPRAYVVPSDVRTPVKNQAHRGTCYIFSTMGIVEASYRRYGIAHGLLGADEYVKFSEQAYGLGLIEYCAAHKQDPRCLGGAPLNETADGQPEWLYYMQPDMMRYVLPDAVCPYQPEDAGQYTCPGLEAAVAKSPISFRVKGIETAYSVDGIKRLLYRHAFPLSFSHVLLEHTYTAPCDDPRTAAYGSEQCAQCHHPCTTSGDGCCAELAFAGYTGEGVFSTFGAPVVLGGHAMMVVGWNDEMAVETGVPGQSDERAVGGFIIKNSWDTTVGHSAEYWAQRHSLLDETAICPNEGSYQTWLPANTTCMLESADPVACGPFKKHVVDHWVQGATVLKCNEATHKSGRQGMYGWTACDQTKRYVIAGNAEQGFATPDYVAPRGSHGLRRFRLVEYDPTDPTYTPVVVETNATSWFAFERLLQPVTVFGNTNHCGYYFMPYDTFLKSNIANPAYGTDTPAFSFIDIDWDPQSFAKAAVPSKDYSLIHSSTYHYTPPSFTGPLDFAK